MKTILAVLLGSLFATPINAGAGTIPRIGHASESFVFEISSTDLKSQLEAMFGKPVIVETDLPKELFVYRCPGPPELDTMLVGLKIWMSLRGVTLTIEDNLTFSNGTAEKWGKLGASDFSERYPLASKVKPSPSSRSTFELLENATVGDAVAILASMLQRNVVWGSGDSEFKEIGAMKADGSTLQVVEMVDKRLKELGLFSMEWGTSLLIVAPLTEK